MRTTVLVLTLAVLAGGCGGVDVNTQGADPLRLLDLSPRLGETGVSPDADVVAVFSAEVVVGSGEGEVHEQSFGVLDASNAVVNGSLLTSVLDPELATIIFRPQAPFAPGSYTVLISGTISGRTEDGPTDPLGVDIHSGFEVGP